MTDNDVSTVRVEANGESAAVEKTKGFDYDGYYKDLINCFFYPLLKRAVPKLYEIADVSVKPRFLDKEFRDILNTSDPEIHRSPHFADFVLEVPTKDGKGQWILCHIEAQGRGGTNLSERMFFYMCLIYAHYRRMPVGLAIITDGHKNEERFFLDNQFGVTTRYEYYNVVLADLDDDELQASDNPIDLAFYAAKCALRTDEEFPKYTYLRKLTDLLTKRGWDTNDKRNLLLFIRRIINLKDRVLQEQYVKYSLELHKEGKLMSDWFQEAAERVIEQRGMENWFQEAAERVIERRGMEKGMEKGIEEMVRSLLADGFPPESVAKSAKWPVERVRTLVN